MWVLQSINSDTMYYIKDSKEYSVGRKNTDIVLQNDESISRTHAKVSLEYGKISITDNSSKYGTYINTEKIEPKSKIIVAENSEIKFGLLQSVFLLKCIKLRVATSNVQSQEKKELQRYFGCLNVTIAPKWDHKCTHLVVSDLILTVKVLSALTMHQPIVTVKYFQDFVQAVKDNKIYPSHDKYLPRLNETLLNKNIQVEYNEARKTLFQGKIFVFLTEKNHIKLAELIRLTGGKSLSWETTKISEDKLNSTNPEYLLVEETLEDSSQASELYTTFHSAVEYIQTLGKRPIPSQEIALAIIHCSCAENCNAQFNKAALLCPSTQQQNTEQILAYDTQFNTATEKPTETPIPPIVVPPSYEDESITPTYFQPVRAKRTKSPESTDTVSQSSKRLKEDDKLSVTSSTSDFSFKRSKPSKGNKNSLFAFDHDIKEEDNNDKIIDNPFVRKRKQPASSPPVEPVAKKIPFENISNKVRPNVSNHFLSSTQASETSSSVQSVYADISSITLCTTWFSNMSVHKKEVKEEPAEDLNTDDLEILQHNESFRNAIVIKTIPVITTRTDRSVNDTTDSTSSVRNFKKFKKVQHAHIQTEIVMVKYEVGQKADLSYMDDDVPIDVVEDDDFDPIPAKSKAKPKGRRRFEFCV